MAGTVDHFAELKRGAVRIMYKKLTIILMFSVLSLGLVRAQNEVSYDGVDPSGQTVVYWNQYSDDSTQENTMSALIEEFNGSNEYGITVEAIHQGGYGDIQALMNTAILSGELPNLVAGYANAAAGWANEGVVVDINLLLNSPEWGIPADEQSLLNFDLLDANQLDFPPFHGMRVAWANQNSLNVFYTNLDIVEALGFERHVPQTLAEFEAISCAAGASEMYQGYPLDTGISHFESFVAAHGGAIFDEGAGEYIFETDEVVATMEMFTRMLDNSCAYLYAEPLSKHRRFLHRHHPIRRRQLGRHSLHHLGCGHRRNDRRMGDQRLPRRGRSRGNAAAVCPQPDHTHIHAGSGNWQPGYS